MKDAPRETCRVVRHRDCTAGNHNFLISSWQVKQDRQVANGVICTRCLLMVDGTTDMRALASKVHETANTLSPGRASGGKGNGSKEDKDSGGQKE